MFDHALRLHADAAVRAADIGDGLRRAVTAFGSAPCGMAPASCETMAFERIPAVVTTVRRVAGIAVPQQGEGVPRINLLGASNVPVASECECEDACFLWPR